MLILVTPGIVAVWHASGPITSEKTLQWKIDPSPSSMSCHHLSAVHVSWRAPLSPSLAQ